MFRPILAALAFAALLTPAAAQEVTPEKIQKAQNVFQLAMTDEIIGDMGARVGRLIADQIGQAMINKGSVLTEDERGDLIVRIATTFVREMKAMEPEVSQVYAAEFSDHELDKLLKLYSDPEMAALMTKMPLVMEKLSPRINQASRLIASEVVATMKGEGRLKDL